MTLKTIEGTFIAPKGRYALVVGRFNSFVVESLVSGAVDALVRHGVAESEITIIRAPGAFEIPLVTQKVAQQGGFDAIIALGAVIRGGTPHFEYVAGECTKGLAQVSLQFGIGRLRRPHRRLHRAGHRALRHQGRQQGRRSRVVGPGNGQPAGAVGGQVSNQDSGNPAAKPPKGKTAARRKARSLAVQALYSWQIAGQPLHEIEAQFRTDNDFSEVDGAYFHEILHGVPRQKSELDSTFEPCLDRPLAEIDPVELAILRLSTYELRNRIDVPYKVVINEGIELAKTFGATDGHKFVNGVLDKLAPRLRAAELRGGKR